MLNHFQYIPPNQRLSHQLQVDRDHNRISENQETLGYSNQNNGFNQEQEFRHSSQSSSSLQLYQNNYIQQKRQDILNAYGQQAQIDDLATPSYSVPVSPNVQVIDSQQKQQQQQWQPRESAPATQNGIKTNSNDPRYSYQVKMQQQQKNEQWNPMSSIAGGSQYMQHKGLGPFSSSFNDLSNSAILQRQLQSANNMLDDISSSSNIQSENNLSIAHKQKVFKNPISQNHFQSTQQQSSYNDLDDSNNNKNSKNYLQSGERISVQQANSYQVQQRLSSQQQQQANPRQSSVKEFYIQETQKPGLVQQYQVTNDRQLNRGATFGMETDTNYQGNFIDILSHKQQSQKLQNNTHGTQNNANTIENRNQLQEGEGLSENDKLYNMQRKRFAESMQNKLKRSLTECRPFVPIETLEREISPIRDFKSKQSQQYEINQEENQGYQNTYNLRINEHTKKEVDNQRIKEILPISSNLSIPAQEERHSAQLYTVGRSSLKLGEFEDIQRKILSQQNELNSGSYSKMEQHLNEQENVKKHSHIRKSSSYRDEQLYEELTNLKDKVYDLLKTYNQKLKKKEALNEYEKIERKQIRASIKEQAWEVNQEFAAMQEKYSNEFNEITQKSMILMAQSGGQVPINNNYNNNLSKREQEITMFQSLITEFLDKFKTVNQQVDSSTSSKNTHNSNRKKREAEEYEQELRKQSNHRIQQQDSEKEYFNYQKKKTSSANYLTGQNQLDNLSHLSSIYAEPYQNLFGSGTIDLAPNDTPLQQQSQNNFHQFQQEPLKTILEEDSFSKQSGVKVQNSISKTDFKKGNNSNNNNEMQRSSSKSLHSNHGSYQNKQMEEELQQQHLFSTITNRQQQQSSITHQSQEIKAPNPLPIIPNNYFKQSANIKQISSNNSQTNTQRSEIVFSWQQQQQMLTAKPKKDYLICPLCEKNIPEKEFIDHVENCEIYMGDQVNHINNELFDQYQKNLFDSYVHHQQNGRELNLQPYQQQQSQNQQQESIKKSTNRKNSIQQESFYNAQDLTIIISKLDDKIKNVIAYIENDIFSKETQPKTQQILRDCVIDLKSLLQNKDPNFMKKIVSNLDQNIKTIKNSPDPSSSSINLYYYLQAVQKILQEKNDKSIMFSDLSAINISKAQLLIGSPEQMCPQYPMAQQSYQSPQKQPLQILEEIEELQYDQNQHPKEVANKHKNITQNSQEIKKHNNDKNNAINNHYIPIFSTQSNQFSDRNSFKNSQNTIHESQRSSINKPQEMQTNNNSKNGDCLEKKVSIPRFISFGNDKNNIGSKQNLDQQQRNSANSMNHSGGNSKSIYSTNIFGNYNYLTKQQQQYQQNQNNQQKLQNLQDNKITTNNNETQIIIPDEFHRGALGTYSDLPSSSSALQSQNQHQKTSSSSTSVYSKIQSEVQGDKLQFFEMAKQIRNALPQNHRGRDIYVSEIYNKCIEKNVPKMKWKQFIEDEIYMA